MQPRHSGLTNHTRPAAVLGGVAALVSVLVATTAVLTGALPAVAASSSEVSTDPTGAHVA